MCMCVSSHSLNKTPLLLSPAPPSAAALQLRTELKAGNKLLIALALIGKVFKYVATFLHE